MIKQSKNVIHMLADLYKHAPKTAVKVVSEASMDPKTYAQIYSKPVGKGFKYKQPKEWNDIFKAPYRETAISEGEINKFKNYSDLNLAEANILGLKLLLELGLRPKPAIPNLPPTRDTSIKDIVDLQLYKDAVPGLLTRGVIGSYTFPDTDRMLHTSLISISPLDIPAYKLALQGSKQGTLKFKRGLGLPRNIEHTVTVDPVDLSIPSLRRTMVDHIILSDLLKGPLAYDERFYETVLPKGTPVLLLDLYFATPEKVPNSITLKQLLQLDDGLRLYHGGDNIFNNALGDMHWFSPNPGVSAGYIPHKLGTALPEGPGGLDSYHVLRIKDVDPALYKTIMLRVNSDGIRNQNILKLNSIFNNELMRNIRQSYINLKRFGLELPKVMFNNISAADRAEAYNMFENFIKRNYPNYNYKYSPIREDLKSMSKKLLSPLLHGMPFSLPQDLKESTKPFYKTKQFLRNGIGRLLY